MPAPGTLADSGLPAASHFPKSSSSPHQVPLWLWDERQRLIMWVGRTETHLCTGCSPSRLESGLTELTLDTSAWVTMVLAGPCSFPNPFTWLILLIIQALASVPLSASPFLTVVLPSPSLLQHTRSCVAILYLHVYSPHLTISLVEATGDSGYSLPVFLLVVERIAWHVENLNKYLCSE